MNKIKVDAVITELELQLETANNPYGSWVCFKFVDTFPSFPKLNNMIAEIKNRDDVQLVDYEYSYTGIHEDTDLTYLEVTKFGATSSVIVNTENPQSSEETNLVNRYKVAVDYLLS